MTMFTEEYVCVQSMKGNTYVAEESEYAARAYDAAKPAIRR